MDNLGNIYVADTYNYRIMKWAPDATNGTLVAGGNGQGAANNQLSNPNRVALDSSGNIYISDTGNNRIMKWEPDATEGTLVAGGNGSGGANAGSDTNKLDSPRGIHVDSSGNIYVSDYNNHRIMKWAPGASDGTLVAGGNGIGSELNKTSNPTDVHVDSSGNMFITEVGTLSASARVVKWTPGASEGIKVAAGGDNRGLDFNSAGKMYVSEKSNHKVMKWTLGEDNGTVFIGGNVGSDSNQLNNPFAIHVDALGNLYTADYSNHRIQKHQVSPQITIPAGSTTGTLTISGIPDMTDEDDKTITLTPTSADNATLSSNAALNLALTDNDNPPTVTFALSANSIEENSSSDVTLTATLSLASDKAIQIPYTVSGTATITDEYTITASPINIAAGATTGTVTISTNGKDDSTVEIIETIILTLGTLVNATTSTTDVTLNLISDDNPSVSSIAVDKSTIVEDGGTAVITATISAAHSKDVTIPLTVTGTATIDYDYSTAFSFKGQSSTVIGGNGFGSALNKLSNPK